MTTTPTPIGHIGLTVSDVAAAAGWYSDVFGWQLLAGPLDVSTDDPRVADQLRDVFKAERVTFRQAHMLSGDVAIELFEFSQPARTAGAAEFEYCRPGLFHICVVEPAIERLVERITVAGGEQRTEIRHIFPDAPFQFCYCADPYGNVIEVATHPHAEAFGARAAY